MRHVSAAVLALLAPVIVLALVLLAPARAQAWRSCRRLSSSARPQLAHRSGVVGCIGSAGLAAPAEALEDDETFSIEFPVLLGICGVTFRCIHNLAKGLGHPGYPRRGAR
jgi:hypothetical protein